MIKDHMGLKVKSWKIEFSRINCLLYIFYSSVKVYILIAWKIFGEKWFFKKLAKIWIRVSRNVFHTTIHCIYFISGSCFPPKNLNRTLAQPLNVKWLQYFNLFIFVMRVAKTAKMKYMYISVMFLIRWNTG